MTERGGFSEYLWYTQARKAYTDANPHPAGYFGSAFRNKYRDRFIEAALKATGLGDEGAATWLTSIAARHMMDEVEKQTPLDEFEAIVQRNTRDAFLLVTIWAHPDHTGSLASTNELKEKLVRALKRH